MANKKRNLFVAIGAVVVAAAVALVVLLWEPAPTGAMVGVSTLPDSLNPILEQNTWGLNADELLFDGLTNFEIDVASAKQSVDMALAENIVQDPKTKKTYTATLKPGLLWHDGTKLTAADVEYSFAAYMDPANKSPHRDYLRSFIESVKAVDDLNVQIEFRKPIPEKNAFPVLSFKIIPATFNGKKLSTNLLAGDNERAFATQPVGSGPFKLSKWEIGKWVSFTANKDYDKVKRKPATETLVIRQIIDPVIRLNEFGKGRINLILETSPLERSKAEAIGGTDVTSYVPYAFYQIAINTKSEAFKDANARAALSAAVKRAELVPGVTDRKDTVVNNGPWPSNYFAVNWPEYDLKALPDPYPYNLDAAKKMADKAKLTGRTVTLLYPDSMGEFGQKLANALVDQYAALGVTVEAKRTGDQVFNRLVFQEKNYELALMYNDGFHNLYDELATWYSSKGANNIYGIDDFDLDKKFEKWSQADTLDDRVGDTAELHQKISALAPAVYLFTLGKDVYSRGLKDVVILSDNPFLSAEDWSLGK